MQELAEAGPGDVGLAQELGASDGVALAYRAYLPEHPVAAVVFYHGGGAHSGAGYPHLAAGLRDSSQIAVYTPDIRGHGESEGERGDAPSTDQLFRDVGSFVDFARAAHPDLPLFVGGHSSGAGLALNYTTWSGHQPLNGYLFLSPQLGFRSKTERPRTSDGETPFAEARITPFIIHAMSGGLLMGHNKAVRFNYPPEALEADPRIVTANTVNLANALTPQSPERQFANLAHPFGLWIGADDEIFDPNKVIQFGHSATQVQAHSTSTIIPNQTHLGILVAAHKFMGPWLEQQVETIQ